MIYFAQIHSNLTYGIGIWGSLISKDQEKKLQVIQNTCLRLINDGTSKSKILNVTDLVELEMCKLWHKHTLRSLPEKLSMVMETDHENRSLRKTHNYSTRHKHLQNIPLSHQALYHNSFLVKGNVLYSQLDAELHRLPTISLFAKKLKQSLLER